MQKNFILVNIAKRNFVSRIRRLKMGRSGNDFFSKDFFLAAYNGDTEAVVSCLQSGQSVNEFDNNTGLQALHIATGRNNLPLARLLVDDWNASFEPDREGRMPSIIAALCEVSDELCDYIVEAEARKDNYRPG
jgi:uncharacterized protein